MNYSNNSNSLEKNNFIADPSLKIDHVHLKVHDLQKSIDFYRSILGFRVLENSSVENIAFLVSQELGQDKRSSLLVLNQIDSNNRFTSQSSNIKMEAGLYHFAILLPERKYLSSFLQHIQNNLDPQYYEGMADHAVSESLYLHDPDSNGIEVYRDRKRSEWVWTSANKVYMVTDPLNINNLLNHESYGTWRGLPSFTKICWVLTIPHPILGHIFLPQIDTTIILPPILGGEQTSYIIVLISLANLDLTILQYEFMIARKKKIY
jgi:catechol 2,3-dioxygenase